jgi:F-type H+-transporting ATPase subunit alpha
MKKVAGRLRLDLAQYRELEAFAAFASDLDKTTKAQLDRGARTVEVLKQPQYEPMPVEQQVMIIYAVSTGQLDDIEVSRLRVWEKQFNEFMAKSYPQVGLEIREKKLLTKEVEEALKTGIAAFKATPAGAPTAAAAPAK